MSISTHHERLMSVIEGPHLSEKAHIAAQQNQIVFKVRPDATKTEIAKAVELLFEVSVEDVQVVNCEGKRKRQGVTRGKRKNWKKAYVRLAQGSSIEFLGGE